MLRRLLLSLLASLALSAPVTAQAFQAQNWDSKGGREEQEREREVPLSSIIRELKMRYGGQHVDARRDGNRYIISWITEDGARKTFEVDAQSGRVISSR